MYPRLGCRTQIGTCPASTIIRSCSDLRGRGGGCSTCWLVYQVSIHGKHASDFDKGQILGRLSPGCRLPAQISEAVVPYLRPLGGRDGGCSTRWRMFQKSFECACYGTHGHVCFSESRRLPVQQQDCTSSWLSSDSQLPSSSPTAGACTLRATSSWLSPIPAAGGYEPAGCSLRT